MRISIFNLLVFVICSMLPWGCGRPEEMINPGHEYKLYFMGGQSNMVGYGLNSDLSDELKTSLPNVIIFHGSDGPDNQAEDGKGIWAPLHPGHGSGFTSDGEYNEYSERFGPELTFGHTLEGLDPESKIAIIKYSRDGTSIMSGASEFGTWDPDFTSGNGVNQYDHFLATVRNAFAAGDLDGDGRPERFIPSGIIWMQGEADAMYSRESAEHYGENLKRLIGLIRAAFRVDDVPVVIGRITDSGRDDDGMMMDYCEIVRRAQEEFVARDAKAALVTSTDGYTFIDDGWHFNSEGYLDLGKQFAEAVYALNTHE